MVTRAVGSHAITAVLVTSNASKSMNRCLIFALSLLTPLLSASAAEEVKIPNALVKLADQLDVPARQAGTSSRS